MKRNANVSEIIDAFVNSGLDWIWIDYRKFGYRNCDGCRLSFTGCVAARYPGEGIVVRSLKKEVYLIYRQDGSEELRPEYNQEFWDSIEHVYKCRSIVCDIVDEFVKNEVVPVYCFDYQDFEYKNRASCYGCIRLHIQKKKYTHVKIVLHEDLVYVVNTTLARTLLDPDPYEHFKKLVAK